MFVHLPRAVTAVSFSFSSSDIYSVTTPINHTPIPIGLIPISMKLVLIYICITDQLQNNLTHMHD
jgi:hypothetical protein